MNNGDTQVTAIERRSQAVEEQVTEDNEREAVTTVIRVRELGPKIEVIGETERKAAVTPRRRKAISAPVVSSLARQNTLVVPKLPKALSERDRSRVAQLQAEFLHVCLPLFFAEHDPVHCLGLTSAIAGEGKSLVAWLVSHALATSSKRPIVLVECDWERAALSRDLGLPASPGLAEWLSGTTNRTEIRYQCMPNLTVIPAGVGGADAVTALALLQRSELYDRLADPDELMILDLPSVLGSYYGVLAARLAESLLIVVRAGSTPAPFITRACAELKNLRVEGLILNQVATRIPRWLQSLL